MKLGNFRAHACANLITVFRDFITRPGSIDVRFHNGFKTREQWKYHRGITTAKLFDGTNRFHKFLRVAQITGEKYPLKYEGIESC